MTDKNKCKVINDDFMKKFVKLFITFRFMRVVLIVLGVLTLAGLAFFRNAFPVLGSIFVLFGLTTLIIWLKLKHDWNLVAGPAGYLEKWDRSLGSLHKNIRYGEGRRNLFDLYIPKDAVKNKPQPVMLFIHGGAWSGGSKKDMAYAAAKFAKVGYITATMSYSLTSKRKPEVTASTMIDEITACIARIKESAVEKGFVINQISLSGSSAGAHLSLLYAYAHAEESPIPIAFVFEQVGPVSFYPEFWSDDKKIALVFVSALTGKKITAEMLEAGEADELIHSISPLNHVSTSSVPTLFAYGGKDTTVPPIHGEKLKEALELNHVPYEWIVFPNSSHMMAEDPDYTVKYYEEVKKFARQHFA